MIKIAVDSKKINFLPKISLALANMTITAGRECKHLVGERG